MSEIISWSAVETAANIAARKVGIVEVTEAHLKHAEAIDPTINALTEITSEEALETARALDGRKTDDLPLAGVPVTMKINVDQVGHANSNGVPAFNDTLCTADSPVVTNLRDAGAVIIGRTSTPEFSMRWCTSNPIHGVTLNPWDRTVTPGGSSGAAAAAVATGIGCIAHGNDLGGSLRYPAFCCGVASIRPSLGRVPTRNPSTGERPPVTQFMSVQGPIARSVGDLRLGLHAMARPSIEDPLWRPGPGPAQSRQGKRDIVVGHCARPFGDDIDPALDAAMHRSVQGFAEAGLKTVETDVPEAVRGARLWGELLFTETSALAGRTIRETGSHAMIRLFETYLEIFGTLEMENFLKGLGERRHIQRLWNEMFGEVDVLVLPTSGIRPFANDLDFIDPGRIPDLVMAQRYLCLINLLGLPSVAVPTHLEDGIPVGVQIVGPAGDDFFVLDAAETLEGQLGRIVPALMSRI